MGEWDGNLRNTAADIVVDLVVLLVILTAHGLQVLQIVDRGSTDGLSAWFLLFSCIYNNHQFANAFFLSAYAWPTDTNPVLEQIASRRFVGARALGAVFGLVHVAAAWTSSVFLIVLWTYYHDGWSPITLLAVIHTAIFVIPALVITLPRPSEHNMGNGFLVGISFVFGTWICLFFLIVQFYPQIHEIRRFAALGSSPGAGAGALSIPSLSLRTLTSFVLAFRWMQRLGMPRGWLTRPPALVMWYQWGFLPANHVIEGVGCAVLVAMYMWSIDGQMPLLA